MSDEKKTYRITTRRPIGGRMLNKGETVALTDREYQAEAGWGGLELATEEAVAAPAEGLSEGEAKEAESAAASKKRK